MRSAAIAAFLTGLFVSLGAAAQQPADWDKLVAAAKKEGAVTLYTGLVGNESTKKLVAGFQKTYGIKVNVLELRASELREKIRTEYVSGHTLGDVSNTSPNQTRQFAEEDGTVEPFGQLPGTEHFSKQVQETWAKQRPDIQLPIFNLYYGLLVNTRLVKDPPETYADLTDPKWKGKILADDFRPTGGGHSFFAVTRAAFGDAYEEKLAANAPSFARDQRESERRVARGEEAIYLPFLLTNYPSLQGLPVKAIALKEGVILTPYSAGLLKHAPHPNAARLLMAYMISDEAQGFYAAAGLMPVVPSAEGKLPPSLKPFADVKVLGTALWENEPAAYAAARKIYGQ